MNTEAKTFKKLQNQQNQSFTKLKTVRRNDTAPPGWTVAIV